MRQHEGIQRAALERLDELLRRDPQRAKVEILKHLDGDLVILSRPATTGQRRAEISGRAKSDSLHLRSRRRLNRRAHLIVSERSPIDVNACEFAGN